MLVYNSLDTDIVNKFIGFLKERDSHLKLVASEIECDEEDERGDMEEWNSKVQNQMLDAKKVVCFLSPNFLTSKECLDSYNMAMCLSRKWHNGLLAPVYLETMPYVQTHLTLNQWIDCRKKVRRFYFIH